MCSQTHKKPPKYELYVNQIMLNISISIHTERSLSSLYRKNTNLEEILCSASSSLTKIYNMQHMFHVLVSNFRLIHKKNVTLQVSLCLENVTLLFVLFSREQNVSSPNTEVFFSDSAGVHFYINCGKNLLSIL